MKDHAGAISGRTVFFVVWAISAVYVATFVDRGWIPHDEGTLTLAAERAGAGELAYRDFEGGYTGGLNYLHALGFAWFGTRLLSLRWVLYVFFLAFVPSVYVIARRFWPPPAAGLVALAAVAWSVPNYFAGMPSWYNLFFAVFGTAALLRFSDTGRRRWLFLAGACGGLSILAKVSGLYFVSAALFFLVPASARALEPPPTERRRPAAFVGLVALGAAALVALVAVLIRRRADWMEVLHFIVPPFALGVTLVVREARDGRGTSLGRCRAILSLAAPFAAGVLMPVAIFLAPYARSGSVGAFFEGLRDNTARQLGSTKSLMFLPPFGTFRAALPYMALLGLPLAVPRRKRTVVALAAAVALGLVLALSGATGVYLEVWHSARSLAVVAVLVGCRFLLADGPAGGLPARRADELFLLLAVAAMTSLVQFPFGASIYFCFVAPLAALALAALVRLDARAPRAVHLVVLVFYVAFAVLRLNPAYVFGIGREPGVYRAPHRLALERGGLLVPEPDGRDYEQLIAAIREVDGGRDLYAAPDCPEVYFLSGHRNLFRAFIDFQDRHYERYDLILRRIEENGVRAVVVNGRPSFSRRLRGEFLAELTHRFPRSREIGRFTLRWR